MSAIAAGFAPYVKPTSVTLIRQDVLPNLPPGLKTGFRIKRRLRILKLSSSPNPDPDKFRLDVSTAQSYQRSSVFTRHPVERGESVTDHRIRNPKVFVCQGWITATPYIPWTAGSFGGSPVGDYLEKQVRQLEEMDATGEPVLVVTSLKTLPNMGITNIAFDRDQETGAGVRVAIRFREIPLVHELQARPVPTDLVARLGGVKTSTSTSIGP